MSSHHFVKEQQEPALLILTLEGWDLATLHALLEWVPTIIVSQETVFKMLSLGIKVDIILADTDFQKENDVLSEEQFPVKFVTAGESRYMEAGLEYLVQSGHHAVNILAFDPFDADKLTPFLPFLDIVFFKNGLRYSPANKGLIQKWLPRSKIQLLGEEGQKIRHETRNCTTWILLKSVDHLHVAEGLHGFKSEQLFWMGTSI
ncbi:thiamine pyrophosphokinase [Cyclobacterium plantarum]|uniref:thiamine pyrophosphokinase n=1 Tax=Cyclobacterium plantarum TaxID=2716263 RepID=UPI003F709BE9